MSSLKKLCRDKRFGLKKLSGGTLFSRIYDPAISFRCYTDDIVYAVKICGTLTRKMFLRFIDENSYGIRNLRFQTSSAARVIRHEVYRKEPFDFSEGSEDNGNREQINVILVCPAPLIISKVTGSTTAEIGNGDDAGEGVMYTGEGFLDMLNKQ